MALEEICSQLSLLSGDFMSSIVTHFVSNFFFIYLSRSGSVPYSEYGSTKILDAVPVSNLDPDPQAQHWLKHRPPDAWNNSWIYVRRTP